MVEVLTDALSLPETPVPLKVARLLLASDILHNSTAPVRNASRYRSLLEAALPDVFESLQVPNLRRLHSSLGVTSEVSHPTCLSYTFALPCHTMT